MDGSLIQILFIISSQGDILYYDVLSFDLLAAAAATPAAKDTE